MAEIIFTLFLFIAITGVTAVLFGGWVLVTVVRVIARGFSTAFASPGRTRNVAMIHPVMRSCTNPRCKSPNSAEAHFCRRCGQHLPQPDHVAVRRAAMW